VCPGAERDAGTDDNTLPAEGAGRRVITPDRTTAANISAGSRGELTRGPAPAGRHIAMPNDDRLADQTAPDRHVAAADAARSPIRGGSARRTALDRRTFWRALRVQGCVLKEPDVAPAADGGRWENGGRLSKGA
jgi:hypothetical protein